jgi:hypothetical protein
MKCMKCMKCRGLGDLSVTKQNKLPCFIDSLDIVLLEKFALLWSEFVLVTILIMLTISLKHLIRIKSLSVSFLGFEC